MKKLLTVLALVLVVATSVVAGTLAVYNVSIDGVIDNNVVAKEFVLSAEAEEGYASEVAIAPTEKVEFVFTVSNTNTTTVTGVDLNATITAALSAVEGKTAIDPLTITLYKKNDAGTFEAVGGLQAVESFTANIAKTVTYKVVVQWPSTANDVNFAGAGFGNNVLVNVSGIQA